MRGAHTAHGSIRAVQRQPGVASQTQHAGVTRGFIVAHAATRNHRRDASVTRIALKGWQFAGLSPTWHGTAACHPAYEEGTSPHDAPLRPTTFLIAGLA